MTRNPDTAAGFEEQFFGLFCVSYPMHLKQRDPPGLMKHFL